MNTTKVQTSRLPKEKPDFFIVACKDDIASSTGNLFTKYTIGYGYAERYKERPIDPDELGELVLGVTDAPFRCTYILAVFMEINLGEHYSPGVVHNALAYTRRRLISLWMDAAENHDGKPY